MPKDPGNEEDIVEVRCPDCNEKVRVGREQAERDYKATCSKGHEIPLVRSV